MNTPAEPHTATSAADGGPPAPGDQARQATFQGESEPSDGAAEWHPHPARTGGWVGNLS